MSPRHILSRAAIAALLFASTAWADNQTSTLSPVQTSGLPYTISLQVADMGAATLPTLQSYAFGSYQDQWIFMAGRTNGLHNFTSDGLVNFPPASQNRDIWIIDPVTRQTWTRALSDSDLSTTAQNALSATATQYVQRDNTLYVAGGYLYANNNFTTYDTLTAVDLAGVVDWVKNSGSATPLSSSVRQTSDATLKVTGGDMELVNGRAHLVFGQDFEGPYTTGANGTYTQQIRSFDIIDNGTTLSIANITATTPDGDYRRRDLNVVPLAQTGPDGPALVALSGVFTTTDGVWTVPVEIAADGTPTMADPDLPETFKQAMNNYSSAPILMYSASRGENHIILPGGLSLQTDQDGTFVTDNEVPFTNQGTTVVRDLDGHYVQFYLGEVYPDVIDAVTGDPLLFGAGAKFLLNPDLALIDGAIDMDLLTGETLLGWVFGGITAEIPNFGPSRGSNILFEVMYTPVPEPSTYALLFASSIALFIYHRRRKTTSKN